MQVRKSASQIAFNAVFPRDGLYPDKVTSDLPSAQSHRILRERLNHGFLDVAEVDQVADLMRRTFPGEA